MHPLLKKRGQSEPSSSQTTYPANFLVREREGWVVACLARPLAHVLNL